MQNKKAGGNLEDTRKLLERAKKPSRDALELHPLYRGKLEVTPKCTIRGAEDFAVWYTPGVAAPCRDIEKNPERVFEHTNKGNFVAVISDGTRVLGLGDIGPRAALPVMEGKAILFKYLGGVDAFPICLDTKDPEEIIRVCKILEPSFGGINLEDIENPKCFYILQKLRREMKIPVWHDDQQGTATIILAGLINALKLVGKEKGNVQIALIGAGAANIAVSRLLISFGFSPGNMVMVDSRGILHHNREDLKSAKTREKWHMCEISNRENKTGGIAEALSGVDICISLSRPGPGVIKKEWVESMKEDAIVFACANPVPEIWPWEAEEAGAQVVATGRSDFPNQVNNSLGFPGIFRGALDIGAKTITDEMCIAAAEELARYAEEKGLRRDRILPTMDDWEAFPRVAVAVAMKAMEQGVARKKMSREQIFEQASSTIKRARAETRVLMDSGIIKNWFNARSDGSQG